MTFIDQPLLHRNTDEGFRPDRRGAAVRRRRVLLIDDDPDFIEILSENLRHEGLETMLHTSSVAARNWLFSGRECDLILLDWYLPEMPGIAFLRAVRDAGIEVPIIVLSGVNKDEIEDAALGCGAVDFVDKTRRFSVLLKRISLALENAGPEAGVSDPPEAVRIGDLTLFPQQCRAHWRGREVGLTVTAFNIVQLMASAPGVDFSYREIYDVVHCEGFLAGDGDDGIRVNVRSLIRRVRSKFKAIDEDFASIENYPAFGYRWRVPEGQSAAGRPGAPAHRPSAS